MAVAVSLLDRFQEREWRFFRAGMFVALGLYGLVPVLHQVRVGGGGGGSHFCIAPAATRYVCVCVGQGRGVVGPLALAHLHGLSASPSSSSRRWDPAPFSTCPSPPPSMQMVLNRGVPQVQQALVIDLIMGATYIVSYQQHAIVHALRSLR